MAFPLGFAKFMNFFRKFEWGFLVLMFENHVQFTVLVSS